MTKPPTASPSDYGGPPWYWRGRWWARAARVVCFLLGHDRHESKPLPWKIDGERLVLCYPHEADEWEPMYGDCHRCGA